MYLQMTNLFIFEFAIINGEKFCLEQFHSKTRYALFIPQVEKILH